MKHWTVQCVFSAFWANTVTVAAETIAQACERGIAKANADPNWESLDECGATFVDAIAEGEDADPWQDMASALPVPCKFSERGTRPPLVTVTVKGGVVLDVRIDGGRARVHVRDYDTDGADPSDPNLQTDEAGGRFTLGRWPNDLRADDPAEASRAGERVNPQGR